MYNNEELLLDLRLNILSKYVKKFILVESTIDHQGNKKKNFFKIENFNKFKDKIIHLRIEDFPKELSGTWERENFQRNYISKSINNLLDNDYIIISDIDEIPNFHNLKSFENYNLPNLVWFKIMQKKIFKITTMVEKPKSKGILLFPIL